MEKTIAHNKTCTEITNYTKAVLKTSLFEQEGNEFKHGDVPLTLEYCTERVIDGDL